LLILVAGTSLSACGGLLQSDAPAASEWWLEPSSVTAISELPYPLVLNLTVVPGLDSDRVLNLNDAARLNSYAGAYWPDTLPVLLESLVYRSLAAQTRGAPGDNGPGPTATASPVRTGERAGNEECLLSLEVQRFFGRVDADNRTRTVEVAMTGQLSCPNGQRVISHSHEAPVGSNRMSAIVAAFQQALDNNLRAIAAQATRAGS
jgi:ABC-type uncharacterized transport system auxiliary subunit